MAKKTKRQLTEKEINQLEAWSAIRLPMESIAALLDMALTELREASHKNDAVRRALEGGRAKAKGKVHRTLYDRAVGRPQYTDENGKVHEEIPVDFQALRFWCQTQEGFKTADKLELTGADGGPIENKQVTKEELIARVAALRIANDLTEDE